MEQRPVVGIGKARYIALGALTLTYMFNFIDRQLLSVLGQSVKVDLSLSDTQLGLLTGLTFALFYTGFGIPLARIADRSNRSRLIALACAVWSFFTFATGFARSFVTLALARVGVGIGEAGASPAAYSIISDYFPPTTRGRALSIYSMGIPLGSLIGIAGGAHLAALYGWRVAFVTIGLLGLVMAALVVPLVKEPACGSLDGDGRGQTGTSEHGIAVFFSSPILIFNALAGGMNAFVAYGIQNWAAVYLQRVQGMTLQQTSAYYSVVAGLSIGSGILAGGFLADRFSAHRPALIALIPGIGLVCMVPFLFVLSPELGWRTALLVLGAPLVMSMFNLSPVLSTSQNRTPARHRATTSAILLFVLNLLGLGGGPLFIGMMSDHLQPIYGADALGHALRWLTPFVGLALALHGITAWLVSQEQRRQRAP